MPSMLFGKAFLSEKNDTRQKKKTLSQRPLILSATTQSKQQEQSSQRPFDLSKIILSLLCSLLVNT